MKTVVVHRGARDAYQVAAGLAEAGLLETLVTDLYWPADRPWTGRIESRVPALRQRFAPGLPSNLVTCRYASGLTSFALSKSRAPSDWKRRAIRWCDLDLGRRAAAIATRRNAALLSYSYYAYAAFSEYRGDRPRVLFQLHPHPAQVRKILQREARLHPEFASSLEIEWELALPDDDFDSLSMEPALADYCLAASSFTRRTLLSEGIPPESIRVIPYGIDADHFPVRKSRPPSKPLRLLFVGTLCQRKGVKYLLDAIHLLPPGSVELTLCGRPVDDLHWLPRHRAWLRVRPSIRASELLEAYADADVFVFPSLAEGFGHVLLEAMSSGLPIVSTDRTAAPDLIRHAESGYLVKPGDAADLAVHIEKFLQNPARIAAMGAAARRRAEALPWRRFRAAIAEFLRAFDRIPECSPL